MPGGLILRIVTDKGTWKFKSPGHGQVTQEEETAIVNQLISNKKEEYTIMEFHKDTVIISTQTQAYCSVFEVKAKQVKVLFFNKLNAEQNNKPEIIQMGVVQLYFSVPKSNRLLV